MKTPCISSAKLTKVFDEGKNKVKALDKINFRVTKGEFVAIVGPSGSGKSTLMNIIGLLDLPSSGEIKIGGRTINSHTNINRLSRIRRETIGFVFQTFNLLPRLSALHNVALPMIYNQEKNILSRSKSLLKKVGLSKRAHHKPSELSGGERQRVAIARALANDPEIILADEPTGNLDSRSGKEVINLLIELNRKGKTLVIITHDEAIAKNADRVIKLKDGKIV